ncbi:hypothetical protein BT63DRAFT_430313 [Microthyrium microscopicum]|uniref:Uncharacterized protein n=1 Tax=Microthyrium microscopicum TaxID=703497 RepID=A0A6A6TWE3_9PEZI|nr:hypothetical protein BT63DRAFT_430313 [Microthyrium microscopicum]
MLDMFLGGPIFVIGLYFQWHISSILRPFVISIPTGLGDTNIQGGRVNNSQHWVYLYQPDDYWKFIAAEIGTLAIMYQLNSEMVRQILGCLIFAVLWAIGWFSSPEESKRWVWAQVKEIWLWMAVSQVMNASQTRRRR